MIMIIIISVQFMRLFHESNPWTWGTWSFFVIIVTWWIGLSVEYVPFPLTLSFEFPRGLKCSLEFPC